MYATAVDDHGFRALAHADRRSLLRLIGPDERGVGELADAAGLTQPAASQQLKVLRDAGLVSVRIDANRRLYSLDFARLSALRSVLDGFWSERLTVLKAIAEGDAS
jgi:DNA-binding transcriptional ArsR family regulator